MTTLAFVGPAATAAAEIITGTSLQWNWPHAIGPVEADEDTFKVRLDDAWRWSSGEMWLTALLSDLAAGDDAMVSYDLVRIKERCDSTTFGVCKAAVGSLTAGAPNA